MRLGKYLSGLTKPELEDLKEKLNLTEEEENVFIGLSKGRSNMRIADDCLVSISTVDRKIRDISAKIERLS